MILFAADENFNNKIMRGLLRAKPDLNIVRVQDAGLSGADDPEVLEWAAGENRILLTHDISTITKYAYDRVADGKKMPGVVEIDISSPIGPVTEDLLLLAELSHDGEWESQIIFVPLK